MNSATQITYFCKIDKSMQKAIFMQAQGDEPRPLLVGLHTWSYDSSMGYDGYEKLCRENNWHLIFPDFRGGNYRPEACGSEMVVSDLEDAVICMKKTVKVDQERSYLVGGSGGGHCSLLMAGRRPDLWAAVSSWCPISDIAAWHKECLGTIHEGYSGHIEAACGGDPAASEAAAGEAAKRSPLTWLPNVKESGLILDISTGIHDGHTGSVPVSQAINAFNAAANPEERISEADIEFIVKNEAVPAHLAVAEPDPAFDGRTIYLRKISGNVRLTIFEGGHDLLPSAAIDWLSRQRRDNVPDWTPGQAPAQNNFTTKLTK